MKSNSVRPRRLAAVLSLACVPAAVAQYTPPPPPQPFPGFLNEYLRKDSPYAAAWDLGGSARFRYEVRENHVGAPPHNDFRAGVDNDNDYFLSKVLLRAGYTDEWWGVLAEARSSVAVSDEREDTTGTGSSPEADTPVDLHQFYFQVGNHKEFPLSLKVGRQELSYGDERIVGAFAWNNIGRVFDGAKLRWQNAWFGVDLFGSRLVVPDDHNFNMSSDYEFFSGAYFNTRKIPKVSAEFYLLARNVSAAAASFNAPAVTPAPYNTSARDIYTAGVRFRSATNEWGNFDYTFEAAGQFGSWKRPANGVRPGERDDHQAFALAANVGYTFAEAFGTPRVALEYAFGSGDSDPADDTHETFDNLYPTNHKFYGYMDLASWQNLHDVRLIFQMRPHARVSVALEAHALWLADTSDRFYSVAGIGRAGAGATGAPGSGTGYGINDGYDPFLGTEIDLIAGVALTKYASLELGYAHFFRGDYIKDSFSVSGSNDADWFYTQLLVRF